MKVRKFKNSESYMFSCSTSKKGGTITYIKPIVLPELLSSLIFDTKEKFNRKVELVYIGRKGGVIIHIHSARRMNEIFTLSGDLFLTKIDDYKENTTYNIYSYMIVKMSHGTASFKAFGWDETNDTLLVKFSNGQVVKFLRPS